MIPLPDLDAPALAELLLIAVAIAVSLASRPWRLIDTALSRLSLATPLLATLAILPVLWSLPRAQAVAAQLPLAGSGLVLLMLGWPIAVLVLPVVAVLAAVWAPASVQQIIDQAFWMGVLPATFALGLGALLRRFIGTHPFVYILGRGFLGTVVCLFSGYLLALLFGRLDFGANLPVTTTPLPRLFEPSWVALWLMSWGDGFVTGMLTAIFVAFRPQWLATWSDPLYLSKPPPMP